MSELQASCLKEYHSSFGSPLTSSEFVATAANLSYSIATSPNRPAHHMLEHLSHSATDLLHIFNLFLSLRSFLSIWRSSSTISIHKIVKPHDSPASSRPISLTSCVSKLFEHIILFPIYTLLSGVLPGRFPLLVGLLWITFFILLTPFGQV